MPPSSAASPGADRETHALVPGGRGVLLFSLRHYGLKVLLSLYFATEVPMSYQTRYVVALLENESVRGENRKILQSCSSSGLMVLNANTHVTSCLHFGFYIISTSQYNN